MQRWQHRTSVSVIAVASERHSPERAGKPEEDEPGEVSDPELDAKTEKEGMQSPAVFALFQSLKKVGG